MLTERFEMRFPPELIGQIDEWRKTQPAPPSRAAAIRALVEIGLKALKRPASPRGGSRPSG